MLNLQGWCSRSRKPYRALWCPPVRRCQPGCIQQTTNINKLGKLSAFNFCCHSVCQHAWIDQPSTTLLVISVLTETCRQGCHDLPTSAWVLGCCTTCKKHQKSIVQGMQILT